MAIYKHIIGTFPLPESQLDRFLMRIQLGYPDSHAERGLLAGVERREIVSKLTPQMEANELLALQQQVKQVFVSPALLDYAQAILRHTRESTRYVHGLSPAPDSPCSLPHERGHCWMDELR